MENYVVPDPEQFAEIAKLEHSGPVHMLNLIKFNGSVSVEDGTVISGKEAYVAYMRKSAPIFERVGGRVLWKGSVDGSLIGPSEEGWDLALIAEYPSKEAFFEMITDEEYKKAMKNRTMAVQNSRLIMVSPSQSS